MCRGFPCWQDRANTNTALLKIHGETQSLNADSVHVHLPTYTGLTPEIWVGRIKASPPRLATMAGVGNAVLQVAKLTHREKILAQVFMSDGKIPR